ncbi:glycosyltransferase family 25 protein [Rickettsia rickettsii]|uniref:Glycosyl transferase family 25 domain-containing protein n=1 Tax=Rickettsia rickettsii (strain Iowa) TaxID=452659 RepID=B0BUV6_RICRO|nr:glycosyltransferase family 25 protein [Rickettsia rickettsii]ABY73016.1 hypothetical protein RrIowa_1261 [Rickettsia rickettsii str. Iowa]AFB21787.1 hypothetical protein RPN_01115 [Rickettsia rickettsii str. Brazil]AFB23995.1 hypothetical protein RPL_05925 [Rickettsia rickettsii str. Colombia]AFB25340.1 hypothetical protein RPO_05935 [Rickettsia rickettsii str. Arizona]AFB28019.1 hypothetical protein RPJ_05880 [Rickettsia rickettsii str. Hino]
MVKDNIPYALIIEDDAILNDDFRNKFFILKTKYFIIFTIIRI